MRIKWFFPLVVAVVSSIPSSSYANGSGFEVMSTLGNGRIVTVFSSDGVIVRQYENAKATNPARGAVVRYSDRSLWGIDHERRCTIATNLTAQLEVRRSELTRALNSVPGGSTRERTKAPIRIRSSGETDMINEHRLRAYRLNDGISQWRLWYADDLPKPPVAVRRKLASFATLDNQSRAVMQKIAGQQPLRVELHGPAGWKKVLTTTAIRPIQVKSSEFAPPQGYDTCVRPGITPRKVGPYQTSASVFGGPGPTMSNVEIYAVYWGPALASAGTGFYESLVEGYSRAGDQRYLRYLKQYGTDSIKLIHSYSRPSAPSRDVGSTNIAAAAAMVYDIGFSEDAPIFWWEVGGHDPLYALFVAESEVDRGWEGYHFVAFSLTHAVLPFPLSLFAHDGMPYFVIQVPDGALSLPSGALAFRAACRLRSAPPPPPGTCSAISSFDRVTHRMTHELVEAASDPYPFFGWSDATKQPAATESEIADICKGAPSPWASDTVLGQTDVATFWSMQDFACVPESRTALTILEPTTAQAISFVANPVVLSGVANDPVDGLISDRIMWQVDGFPLKSGATVSGGNLALGAHTARASVQNSAGLIASQEVAFSIVDQAPQVVIYSPADGATFGTDEAIVFRGGSPLAQQPLLNPTWILDGAPFSNSGEFITRVSNIGSRIITFSGSSASGLTGSKTITINVTQPTNLPGIHVTSPANNSEFPARDTAGNLSDHSFPIVFTAQQVSGSPTGATFQWESDIDGVLGTALSIKAQLSGGPCRISTHKVTATVNAAGHRNSDFIVVMVGQIC